MKNIFLTFCVMCMVVMYSCTYDNLAPPIDPPVEFCDTIPATYDLNMKALIDATCAYSGCHIAGGAAPGDYSTYAGIKPPLDDGRIENRVIFQRGDPVVGMPPDYASAGPQNLTQMEIDMFTCWLEAGYPEN